MSEDSAKVGGITALMKNFVFGAIYIALLFALVSTTLATITDQPNLLKIVQDLANDLRNKEGSANFALFFVVFLVLSIVNGSFIRGLINKAGILTLLMLILFTAVTLVPVKLLVTTPGLISF